jgi:hypothetical protein
MMDYGPDYAPRRASVRQQPRPSLLSVFLRWVRVGWFAGLIALGTFLIASGQDNGTVPFPMQWGGPSMPATVVGPPVAGHGQHSHHHTP